MNKEWQNLPLLAALFISMGLHAVFLLPKDAPKTEFKAQTGAPMPLKLGIKAPPPQPKRQEPVKPIEEEILTTQAKNTETKIAPKKPEQEPEIEELVKPQGEREEMMVVREPSFSQAPIAPVYPEQARRLKQEGLVLVRAQVNAQGQVQAVKVAQSSGFELLDEAALEAVAQWAFLPAQQNDKPITAWIEVPIDFNLR